MKSTLVVVTDLGALKAFKLDSNHLGSTPRLESVEELETVGAHGRMQDKVSDNAGRYKVSATKMATPFGERRNIELENRKRLIRTLAERLENLLGSDEYDSCYFAASREINNELVGKLRPQVRAKIERNVSLDLTKVPKSELLGHF